MYTLEEKKKAVDLFIKYDLSPAAVIHELGYPSKGRLYKWYQEYKETGELSDYKKQSGKYTKEQRETAVKYYLEHGKSISRKTQSLMMRVVLNTMRNVGLNLNKVGGNQMLLGTMKCVSSSTMTR